MTNPLEKHRFSISTFVKLLFITVFSFFAALTANAAPGDLDLSFGTGGKVITSGAPNLEEAFAVAIQSDGKIVTAGYSRLGTSGDRHFKVTRYNTDGSLDTSFGTGGIVLTSFGSFASASTVAIQSDGKIIVAGNSYENSAGYSRFSLARYNTDGSLDNSFGNGGKVATQVSGILDATINSMVIQPDGKIAAAGILSNPSTLISDFALVRYNSDGSLDSSFGSGGIVVTPVVAGSDEAYAIALQPDGKIIAAGYSNGGSGADFTMVRYNSDGSLDSSFGNGGVVVTPVSANNGSDGIRGLALQSDGKIVAVGQGTEDGSNLGFAIVRYNTNGSVDTTFGNNGKVFTLFAVDSGAAGTLIQANGKIVVVGFNFSSLPSADFFLARYNSNGSLDSSFGNGGKVSTDFNQSSDGSSSAAFQPDGKIVVAGRTNASGALSFALARYHGGDRGTVNRFDFDGDSKSDISIYRPSAGEWWINRSSTGETVAAQFGNASDKIVPADFSGDGKTDIAFWRPSTGEWFILRSEDSSFYSVPFGAAGDIPAPDDYDADGKADTAVFRPSTGEWFINKSAGGTDIITFGQAGDVPVAGDYDGDGKADTAIFRPSNGQWWLNRSSAGIVAAAFGTATDIPVAADYSGDGKTDIALWRPASGEWFILRSEDSSYYSVPFGASGDVPAPGDYDGDGKSDPAVFRGGVWYVQRSTSGILIGQFGLADDTPVPAAFLP